MSAPEPCYDIIIKAFTRIQRKSVKPPEPSKMAVRTAGRLVRSVIVAIPIASHGPVLA